MSRSGSPGGSSCAEPDKQLVCNSEASEIYVAPVIPAPSLHAGVACTSSDCNHCVSVAHTFPALELGFLFFLQAKNELFILKENQHSYSWIKIRFGAKGRRTGAQDCVTK